MLEPQFRTLLFDALRPPEGHRLDYGIGTTFSLDLIELLTTPLAFTWFDRGSDEEMPTNALEIVESLRRYADRLAVFCHAGRIHLPRSTPPQLEFLEQSVFECLSPNGGVFHPKIWILRYAGNEDSVIYRFLCLSRNLTFARSWDTMLALEGPLRNRSFRRNDPLATFVHSLPEFSLRDVPDVIRGRIATLAGELRQVDFNPPPDIEDFKFWPLGISKNPSWPFQELGSRTLVISPFLDASLLERISNGRSGHVLISTTDSLTALERKPQGYNDFWVLDERAVAELGEDPAGNGASANKSSAEMIELTGLHAKCYITENGWTSHIWTGSANATGAAYSRNVEFLVQLTGRKKLLGIESLMREAEGNHGLRFGDLLQDAGSVVARDGPNDAQCALDLSLEHVRTALAAARLIAKISGTDGDKYDIELRAANPAALSLPEGTFAACWPVTLSEQHAQTINLTDNLAARFKSVTFESLTAFFAFKVSSQDAEAASTFVLHVPMEGAPVDRRARILRSIVSDRGRLLRFLMLLLADENSCEAFLDQNPHAGPEGTEAMRGQQTVPVGLLESLVRTLDRAPDRIDDIARLLEDLGEERKHLYPEEFDQIWSAIWAVRKQAKLCATR